MGTLLNAARWLGLGLLVIAGAGAAVRVVFNEIMDLKRVSELGRALSDVRGWADNNGYTILSRERVWESPFVKNGIGQLVFHVVVLDHRVERKWAWVLCGNRFEVRWTEPESWSARLTIASPCKDDPLWDQELDA